MDCCICLSEFKNKPLKKLTCGHYLHNSCYLKCTFSDLTKFINCPLCRTTNYNIKRPNITHKQNLYDYCTTPAQCIHTYKNGDLCTNKPYMFNYGYCHNHHKNFLKKNNYKIFLIYLNYIFTTNIKQTWYSKLMMIDMTKQLIMRHNLKSLDQILLFFSKYFKQEEHIIRTDPRKFYKQNNIIYPPRNWLTNCKNHKILY